MLVWLMLGLLLCWTGVIVYRVIRHGVQHHFVESGGVAVVVLTSSWISLAQSPDWFRYVWYGFLALAIAYIAYGSYDKYRGGTDGFGQ
ncbi:hypothetical protein QWJ34_00745 [Saccharibacillus sp. CPCC 101409]|uniref:hypothetical protein n=1 Tax=Saccharibacillus sp. CPCC 101409 TaxID=3058041 RepID=UPI0026715D9C|nr:hypothetical protein [Saccharibacillus sp. CPCC 101409]MDO3408286.1 hypothetical protein [Saccharibacillus sp. CPCC 101409]